MVTPICCIIGPHVHETVYFVRLSYFIILAANIANDDHIYYHLFYTVHQSVSEAACCSHGLQSFEYRGRGLQSQELKHNVF
jgi:hypothetical protein